MKNKAKNTVLSFALAAGLAGGASWSANSHACAAEPLVSSVCVMAMVNWGDFGGGTYDVADGRQMAISTYTALYSLIGVTYGGDGRAYFNIPDLRGRVVMGAGQVPGYQAFVAGEKYGAYAINLSVNQLPPHTHKLTTATVDASKLTATTTLAGLSATANLGGVNVSGPASGLMLKAASGGALDNNPSGKSLGTTVVAQAKIYSDATPTVNMNAGSIGGDLSLSIASGTTAPVAISGNPSTTIGGSASVAGNTDLTGAGASVPLMQPSLVLNYYIAVQGIYPQRN